MNPLNALLKTQILSAHFSLNDEETEYLNDIFLERLHLRNQISTKIIKNLIAKGLVSDLFEPELTSTGYVTARSLFIFAQGIDGFLPDFCRY